MASKYPVTVVVAPAGFGKTTAINQILNETANSFMVQVPREASLAQFVREFSRASCRVFPAMATPPEELPNREDQSEIQGIYHAWLLKHLANTSTTIAIDDIQHGDADGNIPAFIVRLVDETKSTIKWILSSRSRGSLPITRWQAYGESDATVNADELRMTLDEATQLAASLGSPASDEQIRIWTTQTHGFIVPLTYAIRLSARRGTVENIIDGTRTLTFDYLAEQLWSTLSKEDKLLIEVASFAPSVHIHSLENADFPRASSRLARLSGDIAFLKISSDGSFTMHDLFRDFVRQQILIAGPSDMRARQISAACALASSKMYEAAVRLTLEANAIDKMLEIVETSGAYVADHDLTRNIIDSCEQYDLSDFGAGMLALQTEYWGWQGNAERSLLFASEILKRADAQSNHVLLAIKQQYRIANYLAESEQRNWLEESAALLNRLNATDRIQAQSYRASIQARYDDTHQEAEQLLNEIAGYFSQMPSSGKLGAEIAAANAYWWMARHELAITYARSAVTTASAVGSHREMARALNNLGLMLISVRSAELEHIFLQLQEVVERTGSWRFCHVSHWVPATYYALKGDSNSARVGRDLQLGVHPIEKRERERFASFRRHSVNLGNLIDQRYKDVIRDHLSFANAEMETDQRYNLWIDAAVAYFFSDDIQSTEQMLRGARKIHKTLNPIQNRAVLESHLLEIMLHGAVGNWPQAQRLFESVDGNSGLTLAQAALQKYCGGPPFDGLEDLLRLAYDMPFVGLIATMIHRAATRSSYSSEDFTLSSAELEVLRHLSLGKSNKEIALTRGRSAETIKRQVAGVFRKLGVDSRTRALVVAKERGLL